jgi:hypothetical protein
MMYGTGEVHSDERVVRRGIPKKLQTLISFAVFGIKNGMPLIFSLRGRRDGSGVLWLLLLPHNKSILSAGGLPFLPGFQGLKPCDLRLAILSFLRCTLQNVVPR